MAKFFCLIGGIIIGALATYCYNNRKRPRAIKYIPNLPSFGKIETVVN
jgi:hypothetical protein